MRGGRIAWHVVLDATYWVGAVKRSAEGSYMQLQFLNIGAFGPS